MRFKVLGKRLDRCGVLALGHFEHPAPGKVNAYGNVVVTFALAGFVYAHLFNAAVVALALGLADVVVENVPDSLRINLDQVGNAAGRHLQRQQRHDVCLEHQGKTSVPSGPRHLYFPDLALAVRNPGNTGMQVAAVLEEV